MGLGSVPMAQAQDTGESLKDKAERLRLRLGLPDDGTPVFKVVELAGARLGIESELAAAPSLVMKFDMCLQRANMLAAQPVMAQPVMAQPVVPMGQPVVPMGQTAEAFEARAREAEQRAREAEAAVRVMEAEMRARAAEQAMSLQVRHAALEKALRDAMPGWFGFGGWSDEKAVVLQAAIAQAEAAAPPAGSSLLSALTEAKTALRSQDEAKARKEAEERANEEAEAKARARPIQPVRAISAAEAAENERAAQMRAQGLIPAQDLEGCWLVCQPIGIIVASCIGFYHNKALGPNKVKQVACHVVLGLPICCAGERERLAQTNTFFSQTNTFNPNPNEQDFIKYSSLCCDPGVECTLHTKIC